VEDIAAKLAWIREPLWTLRAYLDVRVLAVQHAEKSHETPNGLGRESEADMDSPWEPFPILWKPFPLLMSLPAP